MGLFFIIQGIFIIRSCSAGAWEFYRTVAIPIKYNRGIALWLWVDARDAMVCMVLAVPPAYMDELLEICAIEEVEVSILGTFTDDHRLTVTYHGLTVADMDMAFLHDGRPERTLEAVWQRNSRNVEMQWTAPVAV